MNLQLIIALAVVASVILLTVVLASIYFVYRRNRSDDLAEERTITGIKSFHSQHSQETVVGSTFMGAMEKEKSSSEEEQTIAVPEPAVLKSRAPGSPHSRTPSPTIPRKGQPSVRTTHSRPPQYMPPSSSGRRPSTGTHSPRSWQSPILPPSSSMSALPPSRSKRRETVARSVVLQTIAEDPSVFTHYRDP